MWAKRVAKGDGAYDAGRACNHRGYGCRHCPLDDSLGAGLSATRLMVQKRHSALNDEKCTCECAELADDAETAQLRLANISESVSSIRRMNCLSGAQSC